jgi:hypothetical protein
MVSCYGTMVLLQCLDTTVVYITCSYNLYLWVRVCIQVWSHRWQVWCCQWNLQYHLCYTLGVRGCLFFILASWSTLGALAKDYQTPADYGFYYHNNKTAWMTSNYFGECVSSASLVVSVCSLCPCKMDQITGLALQTSKLTHSHDIWQPFGSWNLIQANWYWAHSLQTQFDPICATPWYWDYLLCESSLLKDLLFVCCGVRWGWRGGYL